MALLEADKQVSEHLLWRARVTTEWNDFSQGQDRRIRANLDIKGLPLHKQVTKTGIVFSCFAMNALAVIPKAYSNFMFTKAVEEDLGLQCRDQEVLDEYTSLGKVVTQKVFTFPAGEQVTLEELARHIAASNEVSVSE